ncbi:MAG: hypothetical protein ACI8SE_002240 [Bacteroidia bacterium]
MKSNRFIHIVLIVLTTMGLAACEKDIAVPGFSSASENYMQMKVGTTWLYKIDSSTVDLVSPEVHYSFFQKEVVGDIEESRKVVTYNINVYRTLDTNSNFAWHDTHVIKMYKDRVVHMGNDFNLIILNDPVEIGQKWYNASSKCNNAMSIIDRKIGTYTQSETAYDDVLDVIHYEYLRHDVSRSHRSLYAKDAGLIFEMRFDRLRNQKTTITKSLLNYAY